MRILLLGILLSISVLGSAQNSGYYGKKNFIEFKGLGNVPVFGWFFSDLNDVYKSSGTVLSLGKDMFNYGFRLSLGRVLVRNTALSLEFGYDYINIGTPYYIEMDTLDSWGNNTFTVELKHEMLDVQTMSIMPKLEFTSDGGLLPLGLNHQIGIGYSISKVKEKDYKYKVVYSDYTLTNSQKESIRDNFINYDNSYNGFTFMYAFNIRTPLSKMFMLSYGMRYTLNFKSFSTNYSSSESYYYRPYEIGENIRSVRFTNFMTFNLGGAFVF